jgi:hypothetical protein
MRLLRKEQDYTKKTGVEFTNIYAPENTNQIIRSSKIWNSVESREQKRCFLAREFEIAFPSELNAEQRKTLLDELCQELVKKHGVIVDAAIHAPHTEVDLMNATIMLTSCLRPELLIKMERLKQKIS